jgi:hypothetical protein
MNHNYVFVIIIILLLAILNIITFHFYAYISANKGSALNLDTNYSFKFLGTPSDKYEHATFGATGATGVTGPSTHYIFGNKRNYKNFANVNLKPKDTQSKLDEEIARKVGEEQIIEFAEAAYYVAIAIKNDCNPG